ncbi:putative trypsin-6 [Pagrus major]|uniref:putative trypsin-6 n=1 Tax=Pagrus major TaxID=143350 RepID=UPI003CC8D250
MGGMTGSLLLLLWAGVSVSTMVDLQKRIINGHDCNDNERQYHVKLKIADIYRCGGSLISDQWILTAAHCWKPGQKMEAVLRVHPGANEIPETINLNNIHQHGTADIMLLKLTTAKSGFNHINLPDCVQHPTPKKGATVKIAGHGATTAATDGTRINDEVDHLKCADIEVDDCPFPDVPELKAMQLFCGKTGSADMCNGDSGGGVVNVAGDRIYGVLSHMGDKACTKPVAMTEVCGCKKWIDDTMKL